MAILLCTLLGGGYYAKAEIHEKVSHIKTGELVFAGGKDLRDHAPFYTIIPCPYCGVEEDRNHDPMKHLYSGIKENQIEVKEVKEVVPVQVKKQQAEKNKERPYQKKDVKPPFICSVADCTLMIRFEEKEEIHSFRCKDKEQSHLNWQQVYPARTTKE